MEQLDVVVVSTVALVLVVYPKYLLDKPNLALAPAQSRLIPLHVP
jgi:hypothetical protein